MTTPTTTTNSVTVDKTTDQTDVQQAAGTTRHSLLCASAGLCPLSRYCPNTGTDECDSGEGCPAC